MSEDGLPVAYKAVVDDLFTEAIRLGPDLGGEFLERVAWALSIPEDPDETLCAYIGAGPLETYLRHNEETQWDRVEGLAREDLRLRRALTSVWADTPVADRRKALLEELGEFWTERVEFVVHAEPFGAGEDRPPEWRAFGHDGRLSNARLATVIREVADWLEQPR